MTMRLAALVGILMLVSGAAIAQNGSCDATMTIEKARDLQESGNIEDCEDAKNLVKADIQGCLTFYGPEECTGPAKIWVQKWGKLEPPSSDAKEPTANEFLPAPSFWGLHVPFTKSATDYLVEYPFASVTTAR